MASLKISQMPTATAVNESDLVPIVQNGENKKVPAHLIKGTTYHAGDGINIDPISNIISSNLYLATFVKELPDKGREDRIYLIKNESSPEEGNAFLEYIYYDGSWELIGSLKSDVDLSEYATNSSVSQLSANINNTLGAIAGDLLDDGKEDGDIASLLKRHREIIPVNNSGLANDTYYTSVSVYNEPFNELGFGGEYNKEVSLTLPYNTSHIDFSVEKYYTDESGQPVEIPDGTNRIISATISLEGQSYIIDNLLKDTNISLTAPISDMDYSGYFSNNLSGTLEGALIALLSNDIHLNATKQDTLKSGTDIKTINNQSIVGPGNIDITEGVSEADFETTLGTKAGLYFPNMTTGTYISGDVSVRDNLLLLDTALVNADTLIGDGLDALLNSKLDNIEVINPSEETLTILPNVLYVWDSPNNLDLTLADPENPAIMNEYMILFTCGDTPIGLALSGSIKWASSPIIEANKTYQISIINNIAVMVGV